MIGSIRLIAGSTRSTSASIRWTSAFDRLEQRLDGFEIALNDLRNTMIRFNTALIIGLLGVIAAILARGA
jgi:hypothetical protein